MRAILKDKLKNEYGAAQVIEMTLIFPLVLFVMGFLIYLGSYVMQSVTIYNDAQRIAVIAAHESQMPGYEHFYSNGGITTKADFNWAEGYVPGKTVIDAVMGEHDPYRYWTNSFLKESNKTTLENELQGLISSNSFLASSNVDCNIETSNNVLSQTIKVNVVKSVNTPQLFSQLGLNSSFDINITAVAVVNDSSEFIRNTDMVFDLGSYLWEELKFGDNNQSMSERVAIFKQKFSDAKAKMGW